MYWGSCRLSKWLLYLVHLMVGNLKANIEFLIWGFEGERKQEKDIIVLLSKVVCHFLWCVGCLAIYKSRGVPENQGEGKFDTLLSVWFACAELNDAMGCCLWADCTYEDVYFNLIWCLNSLIYNQIHKWEILVIHTMHIYSIIYV